MDDILVVELPLSESAYYSYMVALENNSYQLRFTYNEVMELYTLSVYDAEINLLVSSVAMVPDYPMLVDYVIPGLSGFFMMVAKGDTDKEYYKLYPDKLDKYYGFYYFYADTTT